MAKTIIDTNTGEVLIEPPFVKVYIKDLCNRKDLTALQYKIFNFILENMNYSNVSSYGASTKKEFMLHHSIANQTFNNNISGLVKANLISRLSRGEFLVNKQYASKLDWAKLQHIEWTTVYKDGEKIDSVKYVSK